jgi:hypothetical protein
MFIYHLILIMNLSTTLRRKVASLGLVAIVASLFASSVATAQTQTIFSDVPADAWFAPYVQELANAGVLDTTKDTYRPADLVNRAEMAKLAVKAAGITEEVATAAPFNDVAMGQWYTDVIYTAAKNGIVSGDKTAAGVPTGTYRPGDSLNRAEAAKIIINAFQFAEDTAGGPHFPDVASDAWYYIFVETSFNNGIVAGYPDGTFGPEKNINRAEIAKMLSIAMNGGIVAGFKLDSAAASADNAVEVIFSMNVDTATAEEIDNYTIEDSTGAKLSVTDAVVTSADTVKLTTSIQEAGKVYYVSVSGIKSEAGDALSNTDSVSFLGYGADVSGGALEVALSQNTPSAGSVPLGATGVVFTCWDFKAGSDAVMLKSLTVKRVGPGSQGDFKNVYLYNGSSRITTGRSISSETQTVEFNNINQDVASGENAQICLVADIDSTVASGGVHAFEITDAAAVSSNSSDMTGSFPQRGSEQLITSATVGTTTVKKNGSLDEVTIGTSGARIAQFEIAAGTSEDQQLRRIALYVRGRVQASSITNLKLYSEGTAEVLATTDGVGAKDLATFVLDKPFKIARGQSKIFYVTADIASARTGDDIKVYVDETTDVYVTGVTYGYGTQVTITGLAGTAYDGADTDGVASTEADNSYSYVLLKGSKFTIAFNGPAAGDLTVNQKQAKCLDMTITNSAGLDVTIKDWDITVDATETVLGDGGLINTTATPDEANYTLLKLVKLNSDGSVSSTLLGSNELLLTGLDTTQTVTLKGTANIASGQSMRVGVVMDITNNVNMAGDTVKCSLQPVTGADMVKDSNNDPLGAANITPSSAIAGNIQSIVASGLTVTKSSTPADNTKYSKGTTKATILAIQAKAGTSLDQTIKSIVIKGNNTTVGTVDIKDIVDSVGIYDDAGTLISDLKSFPASAAGLNDASLTFNNLDIKVAKNSTKSLTVKATVSNSLAATYSTEFYVSGTPLVMDQNGQTTTGVDVTAIDGTGAPVTDKLILIMGVATVVAPSASTSVNPVVYSQGLKAPLYQFKLKATNGAATLQDLSATFSTTALKSLPVAKVALYQTVTTACDTLVSDYQDITSPVSIDAGVVKFTGLAKTLPDNTYVNLCLAVQAQTVTTALTPESNLPIMLDGIYLDNSVPATATGKITDSSGAALAVTPITGPAIVTASFFQAVPTFAVQANETVLTSSTKILSFVAGSQGGTVDKLNFLAVKFEGQVPTSCSLERGSVEVISALDSAVSGTDATIIELTPSTTAVDWVNGDTYNLKCTYAGVATGMSSTAKLAPTGTPTEAAIIWDDGNLVTVPSTPVIAGDLTSFAQIDEVLFYNAISGTKASAN